MKAITTSVRLPLELRQRLDKVSRKLQRGKNWIIVQALEEYLAKTEDQSFIEEARRQSLLASSVITPDEEFWQANSDTSGWR